MYGSRQDIIGDLFRLRQELAQAGNEPDATQRYHDLEVLAAVAVTLGMSHNLVGKASNVPRDRIEAILSDHRAQIDQIADLQGYQRRPSGVVSRTSR
jgi:hypothetical protein